MRATATCFALRIASRMSHSPPNTEQSLINNFCRAAIGDGRQLKVPRNISLLKLPPYSPELNPVENIWENLRRNKLSNTVFDSYDAIADACCDACNALTAEQGRITPIATRPWAAVTL
jgi:hypothetical protein